MVEFDKNSSKMRPANSMAILEIPTMKDKKHNKAMKKLDSVHKQSLRASSRAFSAS